MPNKLFWLRVEIDSFHKATAALSPEQKGAAWNLLEVAWDQEPTCTLPNDPSLLASASQLYTRWRQVGAPLLLLWVPREDGRLEWPWLSEVYASQVARYETRKERNERHRRHGSETSHARGETGGETSHKRLKRRSETGGETPPETPPPLARENLELRSTALSSNELKSSTAPEARASADAARAAPGALQTDSATTPDTPAEDPASEPRQNGRGRGPETVADVIQTLRPPGAIIRPSVAQERQRALAWAQEHPSEATRVELALQDDVLWEKAKPKQRESMLISAFVKAMHASATNEIENRESVPAHAEVSP